MSFIPPSLLWNSNCSMIIANFVKVEGFQPILKSLYILLLLYCKISFNCTYQFFYLGTRKSMNQIMDKRTTTKLFFLSSLKTINRNWWFFTNFFEDLWKIHLQTLSHCNHHLTTSVKWAGRKVWIPRGASKIETNLPMYSSIF